MFSIPDIRAGNLAPCTRDLLRNDIEIIRVFLPRPSIQIMLSNFKNDGILRIASDPWRANISLYKNVVVARIILYKNTYSTLSLTVANNQITSLCTQILIKNVAMVVYGRKIDQDGRNCSLITSAFSSSNYCKTKPLMFSFGMKMLH